MSDGGLSRFSVALQRLLDTARNYLHTQKTEDDLAALRSLYAEVQLTAPPGVTTPPFCREVWPLNSVEYGPASVDHGRTWQMSPHYYTLQRGSRELRERWIQELEGIAEAVLRQIASQAEVDAAQGALEAATRDKADSAPKRKRGANKAVRDRRTEARDKWIYEQCCKGVAYDTIARRLPKKKKKWQAITTKQGVLACARRYAERNNLPLPPPRQSPP